MIRLPEQFQAEMKTKLGNDFQHFVSMLNTPAPTSVRINPRKLPPTTKDNAVLWTQYGRYLHTRPVFTLDPLLHAGCYYVQEASSMFLEQAIRQTVDLDRPLNILDLSAAPGGKSTHILSLIRDNSFLVSNEVIRSRASILSENIQKWGYANAIVTNNDPKDFQALQGFFDVIVVDAPCSGEGLFRKDPGAMEEWSPDNVALCSSRQKRIIADVWPALKEDGILVYCTCTYNEKENEDNLLWLRKEHAVEFQKLKIDPASNIEESSKDNVIGYRFYPHRVTGEGFFISVMQKKEPEQSIRIKGKRNLAPAPKKNIQALQSWIRNPEGFDFFQHNEFIYFLPQEKSAEADLISQHLKIVNAGTTMAAVKHEKFIPDHALALSVNLNQVNFTELPLSYEDAIKYLRKDALHPVESSKGYCLTTFEKVPLGWVNNLGNRLNNMYPQEWRIRMNPSDHPGSNPFIKLE